MRAAVAPSSQRALLVSPTVRPAARRAPAPRRVVVRAAADDDEDAAFEARLASLKKAKGQMPYGESRKDTPAGVGPRAAASTPAAPPKKGINVRPASDYDAETVYFESGPHPGDAGVNVALAITLVWIPLTLAALGRAAFVRYRFTDRRLSVSTSAPWKAEQLDADYRDVADVRTVGRGVGLWGDMLVVLNNGDKVELRAVPRFLELRQYVLDRRDELTGAKKAAAA